MSFFLSTPDAFDFDLLVDTLHKLKEGKHVDVPIYDFVTHSRAKYKVSALASVHCANVATLHFTNINFRRRCMELML